MKIKILELFGGIGACSKAFEKLGIPYEIVDYVEIDKYAVNSFNAMHGTNYQPQNIIEWNKDIDVDLVMHGSPCQDFSLAGKQAGGDKDSGTRSSLMYETIRIVEKLKPKVIIWENVKNLISKKHKHNFDAYLEKMNDLGYKNYYQVLNAKDYGIPQNRERVFTISIRKDINKSFKFPPKQKLKIKLKDMLEDLVDESFYLSQKAIEGRLTTNYRQYSLEKSLMNDKDIHPTILARFEGAPTLYINNATKKGYLEANEGDGVDISSRMQYHRGNVQKEMIQTLDCTGGEGHGVVVSGAYARTFGSKGKLQTKEYCDTLTASMGTGGGNVPLTKDLRIRKLTPKECWRLMGFEDIDYEKASRVNSKSQLYKQAGNSIVVNVLEEIIKQLLDVENKKTIA